MIDREAMLEKLVISRQKILEQLAEIDRQRKIYPMWTIRELVAHISGWDDAIIATLNAHLVDTSPGLFAARGVDVYNEETVSTREGLDYDHIYREFITTREKTLALIRSLPEDKLETEMIFPWGDKGNLKDIIHIFSRHEEEHAEDVAKIIRDIAGG